MCLNGKFSLSFLPLFGSLILGGCTNSAIPEPSDLVCPAPDSSVMGAPEGVVFKKVNQASFVNENGSLRIKLADTSTAMNPGGGFSDENCSTPNSRNGNKAFIGFTGYAGKALSDLISFRYTVTRNSNNGVAISPYFLVDCGNGDTTVIIVDFAAPQLKLPVGEAFVANFKPSDVIYRTSSGTGCGVIPSFRDPASPKALTDLPAMARLVDMRPAADCGMPRCTFMQSFGITDGDSRATDSTDVSFTSATAEWRGDAPRMYRFGQ